MQKSFWEESLVFPIEKFPSLVQSRNAIMLQHLRIKFSLYDCQVSAYEVSSFFGVQIINIRTRQQCCLNKLHF